MTKKKTPKIGQLFRHKGINLRCEASSDTDNPCEHCAFEHEKEHPGKTWVCAGYQLVCESSKRSDNTNVVFIDADMYTKENK